MLAFEREAATSGGVHVLVFTMNADGSGVTMISRPLPTGFNGFPSRGGRRASP